MDRLAIIGRAFQLASYGLERQLRLAALALVLVAIVGGGRWYLDHPPAAPHLSTMSAASGVRPCINGGMDSRDVIVVGSDPGIPAGATPVVVNPTSGARSFPPAYPSPVSVWPSRIADFRC